MNLLIRRKLSNLFNPTITIEFTVPKQTLVNIKIYNVLGKEISTLINEEFKAGVLSNSIKRKKFAERIIFLQNFGRQLFADTEVTGGKQASICFLTGRRCFQAPHAVAAAVWACLFFDDFWRIFTNVFIPTS